MLIIHLQRFEVTPWFTVKKTHKAISLSAELLLNTNQSTEKVKEATARAVISLCVCNNEQLVIFFPLQMKYSLKSMVNHFGIGVEGGERWL